MKPLFWIPLLLAGCAGHLQQTRPAEPSRQIVLRHSNQRPVDLSEEAFRAALLSVTAGIPVTEPAAPTLNIQLAASSVADLARTRRYLEWCQQADRGGGDCAGVLKGTSVFGEGARVSFALHIALSGALREAAGALGAIKPEQVRAAITLAILISTGLMVSPDPLSKLLAIGLTCNLIAFLGVDLFNHAVLGYLDMRNAALATQDFDVLVGIGGWYARMLGPSVARVAVMLATWGIAKTASMLPALPSNLPGSAVAAANAEAAGLPLGQLGAVQGVAVAASGTVTVTVVGTMAMSGGLRPNEQALRPPPPRQAAEVQAHIREHGTAPPGMKGGRAFDNDGRDGSQILPKTDSRGNPIAYREWDVKPHQKGVDRGPERLVTGSDGKAYYTSDHYKTFVEMP